MNFKLLFSIAVILTLFACNASKKVELTKNETDKESTAVNGKSFEGKIFYDFVMKDKTGELPDEMAGMMFGSKQVYTTKKGMYKSEMDGQMNMTITYRGNDSLFLQMNGIEGLLWNDVKENTSELISIDIKENAETVMGKKCDLITIKTNDGTSKYYYSSDYPLNPADFSNHEYDFWNLYVEKAKAIPLKIIVEDKEIFLEAIATEAKPMKIDDSEFNLPNIPRVKNPEP